MKPGHRSFSGPYTACRQETAQHGGWLTTRSNDAHLVQQNQKRMEDAFRW